MTVHVDRSKLDDLRALDRPGREGFLRRICTVFLDDAARRLDEIDRALAAGDDPAVGMAAHALKGSCAYLGAVRLGELCRSLEERANAADLSEGAATAAGIRDEFATVAALLAEELEKS